MAVRLNTLLFLRGLLSVCIAFVAVTPVEASPGSSWLSQALQGLAVRTALDKDCAGKRAEEVYTSCLNKDGNTITLRGRVPSDNDLKILQGILAAASAAASQKTTLVDKSDIDDKVPDYSTWLLGMNVAIRHLMRLEKGNVTLQGNSISLDGITRADDNFGDIRQKIFDEVPKGLTLKQTLLRPAAVRPFVWLAEVSDGSVSLSGYVPDEVKDALVNYAGALFQSTHVSSAMAAARGAPDGWFGAAQLALEMLSRMRQGRVILSDRVITLEGVFSSPGMAELLKDFNEKLPKGFRLEAKVVPSAKTPA